MTSKPLVLGLTIALAAASTALQAAAVSTFEDLSLPPESFFLPGAATSFTSGAAAFQHEFTEFFPGCCWNGWTYSNRTDTATPGFMNDTSAIPGGGAEGSANYGVAFLGTARLEFAAPTVLKGAYFTNTTYTYLAMKNGDDGNIPPFVKGPFEDGDFFRLTVEGRDAANAVVATIDVLLADGANVVDDWLWVDLDALGAVSALTFALASSDSGPFGPNTPTYFALDNLTPVPLPGALWLLGSGLAALGWARRGRSA